MKNTAIAIFIIFLFPVCLFADQEDHSLFCQEYAEVNHSLMSDQGVLNELTELLSLDMEAVGHIADFWRYKAGRECCDFVEKIKNSIGFKDLYKEIDYYVDKKTTTVSGGKYEELRKKAQKEAEQCRYGVYFDNWEEINKMIVDKLKAVKEKKIKNEQKEVKQ